MPRPPADKLVCPAEPLSPVVPAGATQKEVDAITTDYLKALRQSWFGCWSAVEWNRDYWDRNAR